MPRGGIFALFVLMPFFSIKAQETTIAQFELSFDKGNHQGQYYPSLNHSFHLGNGRSLLTGHLYKRNWPFYDNSMEQFFHATVLDSCKQPVSSQVIELKNGDDNHAAPKRIGNTFYTFFSNQNNVVYNQKLIAWDMGKGVKWCKGLKEYYSEQSILTTKDSGILVLGRWSPENSAENVLQIMKFSKQGGLEFQKSYTLPEQNYANSLSTAKMGKDHFLLAIGSQLIRIDDQGSIEKAVKIETPPSYNTIYWRTIEGSKNGPLFGYGTLGISAPGNQHVVVRIDKVSLGLHWNRHLAFSGGEVHGLEVTPDSNVAFLKEVDEPGYNSDNDDSLSLVQFNIQGELLLSRYFPNYHRFFGIGGGFERYRLAYDKKAKGFLMAALSRTNVPEFKDTMTHLIQLDKQGKNQCAGKPFPINIDTLDLQTKPVTDYKLVNKPLGISNCQVKSYEAKVRQKMVCSKEIYPFSNLGFDTTICYDSTLTLAPGPDTPALNYQWNTGATTPVITVDSSGWYKVAVVSPNGCTALDSIHVNFLYEHPANLPGDTTLCSYDSLHVNLPATGDQFLWQTPSHFSRSDGDTVESLDTFVWESGTYRLYQDSIAECPLDTFQINRYQPPQIELQEPDTICPYDSVLLDADTSIGAGLQWVTPGPDPRFIKQPAIRVSDTGHYRLEDSTHHCSIDSVELNHYRLPEAKAGPDTTLCYNQEYTMQGEGGITYQWIPAKHLSSDTVPKPIARIPDKEAYALVVQNEQGCSDTARVVLDVHPPLEVELERASPIVCEGTQVRLEASGTGGKPDQYQYFWRNLNEVQAVQKLTVEEDREFRVQLRDGCSEPAEDSFQIETRPSPTAGFQMDPPDTVYVGSEVNFENQSSGAVRYEWDFGSDESRSTQPSPRHTYEDTGLYTIKLVAQKANQCRDTVYGELYVIDNYEVYIPNAFTPDGNQLNEEWEVKGRGIESYSFKIYNRWGERIYESAAKDQPSWDGTYRKTGEVVPKGVYIYQLQVVDNTGMTHYYHGDLHVVK